MSKYHADTLGLIHIGPCKHPRCRDTDGNPRLTLHTVCDPCRTHLRRQLDWLSEDYTLLRTTMPKPISAPGQTRTIKTEFGHPAEWASDMARAIAHNLNRIEDDARADLGDPPSFNTATASEGAVVKAAHHYLSMRLDRIIDTNRDTAEDLAVTVHELHSTIRRALGYTKQVQRLAGARCPTCDQAALIKSVGQVDCESCGRIIPEDEYTRLAEILACDALDILIESYDTLTELDGGA